MMYDVEVDSHFSFSSPSFCKAAQCTALEMTTIYYCIF